MKIDSYSWRSDKRICISIDDELFKAYLKYSKKREDILLTFFKKKIKLGDIKNSNDAKLFIYSQLMKPSAFKCFAGELPEQMDVEDM